MKAKFMKKIFLLNILALGLGISGQAHADYSDMFKNEIMQGTFKYNFIFTR